MCRRETTTKTKKSPYTFAGGRVEHLPGIRTFVLTLPDGRGELSVDGDRVELSSENTRETLRLPAQLAEPVTHSRSLVRPSERGGFPWMAVLAATAVLMVGIVTVSVILVVLILL